MNFKLWRKNKVGLTNCTDSISCTLTCTELGGRLSKDGTCYTYDIVKRICVKVDMIYSEDYKNSAIILDGGCYGDNEAVYYVRAEPDKLYKLDFIPVEVRSKYDPYTSLTQSGYVIEKENTILSETAYILLIAGFLFAVVTFVLFLRAKKDAGEEGQALRS